MDFKKYWPYLVLVIGAILSIGVAFISIQSLRDDAPEPVATSTHVAATTTAPQVKKKSSFLENLVKFFSPVGFIPGPPTVQPTYTPPPTTPAKSLTPEQTQQKKQEEYNKKYYPNYQFAPSEPPPITPAPVKIENRLYLTRGSYGVSNPDDEYLILTAGSQNTEPMLVTGMKVHSAITLATATIGEGVDLYFEKQTNPKGPIFLKPGGRIYLFSGHSPLAASFRLNKCFGYLNSYYNFRIGISTNCPLIQPKDLPVFPNQLSDKCLDFIGGIGQCVEPKSNWKYTDQVCENFIRSKYSYGTCVAEHRNDSDFYYREWRVYLDRSQPMWKSQREHVQLIDTQGKVLSEFSY
jgi:hypothetical protein